MEESFIYYSVAMKDKDEQTGDELTLVALQKAGVQSLFEEAYQLSAGPACARKVRSLPG